MNMTQEELKKALSVREGCEIEYKSAKGGFPGSFWETFSAFANTNGGVIVLGVKEKDGKPIADGMSEDEAIKHKKTFWDCAHNSTKVSAPLLMEKDVHEECLEDGSWVLVCEIPRAAYDQKPIYLNGNPDSNTFKRKHEGDYRCTKKEVRQMFSDSNLMFGSADARILKGFTYKDIDEPTVEWYRKEYNSRHDGHPWTELSNMEFLKKVGAYRLDSESGEEGFTVAGMQMFGKGDSITAQGCLPYFFVDYRERLSNDPAIRWTDRIYPDGRWEANLFQFYQKVLNRLYDAMPMPFRLADNGITRLEYTSAHLAVREALVNALIHASYTQMGNIVIDRWQKKISISNPGCMLVSVDEFYNTQQSICRNPLLQKMFVLIGVGEKAGSGADTIVKGWSDNHWSKPEISEHTDPERVEIVMYLADLEKMIQAETDIEYHSGTKFGTKFGTKLGLSWEQVFPLFEMMSAPTSASDLRKALQLSDATKFKEKYLNPLIQEGLVAMTQPDKLNSPKQKYYLTDKGKELLSDEKE